MRCKRLARHPTTRQLVFNINNTYNNESHAPMRRGHRIKMVI
jgi:hypothetical protein